MTFHSWCVLGTLGLSDCTIARFCRRRYPGGGPQTRFPLLGFREIFACLCRQLRPILTATPTLFTGAVFNFFSVPTSFYELELVSDDSIPL